jgi:putative endonuclease
MLGYYVYLLASGKHGTLYLGVTNDLIRRVYQHKNKLLGGFTARYGIARLVWFECHDEPGVSDHPRERDQEVAARLERSALIEKTNPDWRDLYDDLIQ